MKSFCVLKIALTFLVVFLSSAGHSNEVDITVLGLFKGSALLDIDGKQKLLKEGTTSDEGVTVVSADSKRVIIFYQGVQQELNLTRRIGSRFAEPSKAEVRLPSSKGGHYWASGTINGRAVQMMVDTGATSVAMSERDARRLGIDYQQGLPAIVNTAGGQVNSWRVNLNSVAIGNVVVQQVPAVILAGNYPDMILLGNSFLDKVDLDREQGVLVIKSRY